MLLSCLSFSCLFSLKQRLLFIQTFLLPSQCLHIILQLCYNILKLSYFLHLPLIDSCYLIFLLFLLHRQLFFIHHFQLVGFFLTRFVLLLHTRKIFLKLLQQYVDCFLVLLCQMHYLFFLSLLHLQLISNKNL